jgi:heat shock protein HspQ
MIRLPDQLPKFEAGQMVRHLRYGYRGVVVAFDTECRAPQSWYESNRTQPLRQQPWYHVLVHGSSTATYAAQDSLEADDSVEPIRHPLLEIFFDAFDDGHYIRNQRAWHEW